jgi:hypothetical protein
VTDVLFPLAATALTAAATWFCCVRPAKQHSKDAAAGCCGTPAAKPQDQPETLNR